MSGARGGDKLATYLGGLSKKLQNAKIVRVGFLEGATYPSGTPVALVAAVQNFGAPAKGIPARPFFSNMVDQNSPHWSKDVGTNLKATGYDAARTLGLMGEQISGELRQSIIDTNTPPLSPRTVKRKGSSKPLVDKGTMLRTVDHEVA